MRTPIPIIIIPINSPVLTSYGLINYIMLLYYHVYGRRGRDDNTIIRSGWGERVIGNNSDQKTTFDREKEHSCNTKKTRTIIIQYRTTRFSKNSASVFTSIIRYQYSQYLFALTIVGYLSVGTYAFYNIYVLIYILKLF